MPTRSNRHIKKFNQLVEVYEPAGIEPLETVTSRDDSRLESRKAEIVEYKTAVEKLGPADFFDESRREDVRNAESMPEPAAVADSQRADMLKRLEEIETALAETIADGDVLDTSDDLGL